MTQVIFCILKVTDEFGTDPHPDPQPDPHPLDRYTDPRTRSRTKMWRIRNADKQNLLVQLLTVSKYEFFGEKIFLW